MHDGSLVNPSLGRHVGGEWNLHKLGLSFAADAGKYIGASSGLELALGG